MSTLNGRALREVTPHTANFALTEADNGTAHTNTGAAGSVVCALPAAKAGMFFFFALGAAQQLRLDPNLTETISLPSTGVPSAAGKYIVADAVGETVAIMCFVDGTWAVIGYTGTWTAEA